MTAKTCYAAVASLLAITVMLIIGCGKTDSQVKTATQPTITANIVQKTCPVMGGPINEKLYIDVKGRRIYVCCQGCIVKIKEDPDTYIAKVDAEIEKLSKQNQ